ncbi:transglutaminase-like domain-containing protein [Hoeflea sp. YIM 152468]|uniref:transglutaminase-like domain-containing protein n=1 Tax=Hoeflea sp. YIM 152468 TaxID=3031759 RepID=UPI0023D9FF09|nr:transglutaminase-like domain-containing protein [Hoeflea sp. YIM 152468]MDF1610275.1 transglutaminase-like domain-containing protein [Hoeflea sp. YIM 152468]
MSGVSRKVAATISTIGLLLSASFAAASEGSLYQPVDKEQLAAAQSWLKRNDIPLARLQSMSPSERAKILTFYVYKHCRVGSGTPENLAQLYDDCATQCGGYSYVYRGLAEAAGLTTRYARLYNIPNQGNHVAVEVQVDNGKWGYFDPTFGSYFSNPESADQVLDLREITTAALETLEANVHQANKDHPLKINKPITEIFDGIFDHQYMSINNYRVTEAISNDNPNEHVVLEIPLELKAGEASMGSFDHTEFSDLSKVWLEQTNASLNDDDEFNDISYVASYLTNTREDRTTMISLSDLEPGQSYTGKLRLINPSNVDQTIQLSSLGRGLQVSGSGLITLQPGTQDVDIVLKARQAFGQFYVRKLDPGGIAYLFGIKIGKP